MNLSGGFGQFWDGESNPATQLSQGFIPLLRNIDEILNPKSALNLGLAPFRQRG